MVKKFIALISLSAILEIVTYNTVFYYESVRNSIGYLWYILGYSFIPMVAIYAVVILIYHWLLKLLSSKYAFFNSKLNRILLAIVLLYIRYLLILMLNLIDGNRTLALANWELKILYPIVPGLIVGILYNLVFNIKFNATDKY
jgi:hypothetical protein